MFEFQTLSELAIFNWHLERRMTMRTTRKPSDSRRKALPSSTADRIVVPKPSNQVLAGHQHDEPTEPITLSESRVTAALAKCQPYLLALLPKAINALTDGLDSENPRVKISTAIKLLQGVGIFESRGNNRFRETAADLDQRENEKGLMTAGLIINTFMEKAEIYNMPLPEDLAWLAPKLRELQQEIRDKKKAGELSSRDPAEIPPLRSHSGRDQSKGDVRGYGRIIQKESAEP
jgi:hypothetical protein